MISLTAAALFAVWILRSYRLHPAFFLTSTFLSWQFGLKIIGTVFVDLFGPVYADEVFTFVGGQGASTPVMVLFTALPLLLLKKALTVFHRPLRRIDESCLSQGGFTQGDLIYRFLVLLIICLYVDMIRLGQIPLFSGLDRFEYRGGLFHNFTLNFLFLIGQLMGYAVARTRLVSGQWDTRFATIITLVFSYLFLTGHRFGAYYTLISFFLAPMAAIFVAPKVGISLAPRAPISGQLKILLLSKGARMGFYLALTSIILVAMANSLLNVRDGDPLEALKQRILIQPIQLFWLSWERWKTGEIGDIVGAWDFMFRNPFDLNRNTGIQYLMVLHLGEVNASRIYESVDYAGGYPELLLELGGLWFGVFAAFVASAITALLYRIHVVAVCRGHLLTCFFSIYVCFGVINLFLGGMLNFLTTGSYWIKIGILFCVILFERDYERSGKRLIPWVLVPGNKMVRHKNLRMRTM
jgi:hypothetical protein